MNTLPSARQFLLLTTTLFSALISLNAAVPAKQLKVFILAGQSNMQGQGIVTAQDKDGSEKPGTRVSMPQNPVIVLKFMA